MAAGVECAIVAYPLSAKAYQIGKSGTKNLLAPIGPVKPITISGITTKIIFDCKGSFLLKAYNTTQMSKMSLLMATKMSQVPKGFK